MRRHSTFLAAVLGTLLLAVPLQSQAFFGFFGGGFSFGTGWGGWGGPGWWGPGWWGHNYWGGPGYFWHRPYYHYRPWHWRHFYRPYLWNYYGYGPFLPYVQPPVLTTPAAPAAAEPKEK
jgi:hypothetical protein